MLNTDGAMLEVKEKFMHEKKWSEMTNEDISTKMDFWWRVLNSIYCRVTKLKTIMSIIILFRHFGRETH